MPLTNKQQIDDVIKFFLGRKITIPLTITHQMQAKFLSTQNLVRW